MPFRPGGYDRREQNFGAFENQLPPPPPPFQAPPGPPGPYGPPNGFFNQNFAPPPPPHQQPPHMFNSQQAQNEFAGYQQALAYHHWMLQNGHPNHPPPPPPFPLGPEAFAGRPHPHMPPHGQPPFGGPPFGQQPYGHKSHHGGPPPMPHQQRQMFPNRPPYPMMQQQANFSHGARNEDIQYAFDALLKGLKSKNHAANTHNRAPTPPGKKSKSGLTANGHAKQKEYGTLHRIASFEASCSRINKLHSTPKAPKAAAEKKGRYGDEKIMLPAPQPTQEYLDQAAGEPTTTETPGQILVILDLNGTVLFRPNRNAKTMIQRPFLGPFLRYLFENFKVMVWSSARPDTVKSLVSQALDNDLRSKLVAQWARDSFGLSPTNYQQNVQVYKNLKLVWSRSQIQSFHPDYEAGSRFGQHNTVLIDDSSIKASAQPHNLLEIPEFSATPEQMQGDVLREIAGYLEALRTQADVSRFIQKQPFTPGGQWTFDWPDDAAGGGELTSKVSAGVAPTTSKKKNKKQKAKEAAAAASRTNTPLNQAVDTLVSASLAAPAQQQQPQQQQQ